MEQAKLDNFKSERPPRKALRKKSMGTFDQKSSQGLKMVLSAVNSDFQEEEDQRVELKITAPDLSKEQKDRIMSEHALM